MPGLLFLLAAGWWVLAPSADPVVRPACTDLYGDPLPPGAIARLGTIRFRNRSDRFLFSPDGKALVLEGSFQRSLLLCDAVTGQEICRFRGQGNQNFSPIGFSPDGRLLVTEGDNILRVWGVPSGQQLWSGPIGKPFFRGIFSSNGRTLVYLGRDRVMRWCEAASGKLLRRFPVPGDHDQCEVAVSSDLSILVATTDPHTIRLWNLLTGEALPSPRRRPKEIDWFVLSPDGKTLAFADAGRLKVHLWEIGTGKESSLYFLEKIAPFHLRFSPDGKMLAALAEEANRLYLWEAGTGKVRLLISRNNEIPSFPLVWLRGLNAFAFSPDSRLLATGDDLAIQVWDVARGRLLRQLQGRVQSEKPMTFSPNGQILAAQDENAIRFWNTTTWKELPTPPGHTDDVCHVVFSMDGRTLATGGLDRGVRLWDASTGKPVRNLKGQGGDSLDLSSDSQAVASWNDGDLKVGLWEVATGRERWQFEQVPVPVGKGHCRVITKFSPDGKTLAVAAISAGTIHFLDVATGKARPFLVWPEGAISDCTFSPDGRTLAISGTKTQIQGDYLIDVLEVATARSCLTLPKVGGQLFFSPDGKILAGMGTNTLRLWELASGKEVARFDAKIELATVSLIRNDRILAVGKDKATDRFELWDLTGEQRLRLFSPQEISFRAFAFSPDGTRLATADWDTSALIWAVPPPGEVSQPSRGLTRQDLTGLWSDLAGADAPRAFQAVQTLARGAKEAVPFLKEKLQPVPNEFYPRLIADLDNDRLVVRETAARELARLDYQAEPALRAALQQKPTLEVRRRVENLLESLNRVPPPPDLLRQLRAIRVLEQIGSPEACAVVDALARGAPESRITQEAAGARKRLGTPNARRSE